jgi:hypothetical protein
VPSVSGAPAFPDTAAYDPEFAGRTTFVLGLHGQLFLAVVLLVALAGGAVTAWHTRS